MSDTTAVAGEASLRREIGIPLGVLIVINATIGTGIFKTPAKVARLAGSLPASMLVWIAGGIVALCGALTLAELAAALPRTGGIYEYLRRAWGPSLGFLFGWAKLTLLIPSAVGSFAKLGAEALAALAGAPPDPRRDTWVSIALLLACALVNLLGVRRSAMGQAVITLAKYLGVALLAFLGLALTAHGAVAQDVKPPAFHEFPTWTGCFTALVSVMWAYDGWADLASLSGEVRRPERSLPRALVAGTLAIIVVYLAANLGYARALGIEGLRRSTTGSHMAASWLATLTLGDAGRRLMAALVLVSCVGGCMSSLLTGSRIFVPLATDGLFSRWLGHVTQRSAIPARAVIVCTLLGVAYVSVRSFEQLTEAFVVGYFPFYMLAVGAVFVLRRREPNLQRPFRVPAYPVVPIVFLAGALALMIGAIADADRTALFPLIVLALGVVVKLAWPRRAA